MNYGGRGQLTLSDRIGIETGICNKESFKKIGKTLGRHPSTIAHEVKGNRTYIKGNYFAGNDCKVVRNCREQHVCGDGYCDEKCFRCRANNCHNHCKRYISVACHKFEKAPYVCNTCAQKKLCNKD